MHFVTITQVGGEIRSGLPVHMPVQGHSAPCPVGIRRAIRLAGRAAVFRAGEVEAAPGSHRPPLRGGLCRVQQRGCCTKEPLRRRDRRYATPRGSRGSAVSLGSGQVQAVWRCAPAGAVLAERSACAEPGSAWSRDRSRNRRGSGPQPRSRGPGSAPAPPCSRVDRSAGRGTGPNEPAARSAPKSVSPVVAGGAGRGSADGPAVRTDGSPGCPRHRFRKASRWCVSSPQWRCSVV